GDGFGGASTSACTPPDSSWITTGGDCDDGDKTVFPGQTSYFTTPYSVGGGLHSFDYDCNKKEDEQPPPVKQAGVACVPSGAIGGCTGDGYLPNDTRPPGIGIDRFCGSTKYQVCTFKASNQTCTATIVN